jgi:beta-N-acetylhexosaminidase
VTARALEHLAGRCLMLGIRGSGPHDPAFRADLEACREAHVGGIILFDVHAPAMRRLIAEGATPEAARARATRNIQSPAQLRGLAARLRETLGPDLLIAIDQEGGAVARLNLARGFPATIPAADFAALDPPARRRAAAGLARTVAEAGIDINFAPCVDLALDEAGFIARAGRAFSADPDAVIACARDIVDIHRADGVITCLKHFPGHGSAHADSHEQLPDITDTHQPDVELAAYRALCAPSGAAAPAPMVMTGHLLHRRLDPELPASLSPAITTGLLRRQIGFEGVIVTDSLDMRAVRDRWDAPTAAILALRAGADLVLDAHNLPPRDGDDGAERACEAVEIAEAIARAVRDGTLDLEALGASAARIARLRPGS